MTFGEIGKLSAGRCPPVRGGRKVKGERGGKRARSRKSVKICGCEGREFRAFKKKGIRHANKKGKLTGGEIRATRRYTEGPLWAEYARVGGGEVVKKRV